MKKCLIFVILLFCPGIVQAKSTQSEMIYQKCAPAVVLVSVETQENKSFSVNKDSKKTPENGYDCAGFVVGNGDLVVTCFHVLSGATKIEIIDQKKRSQIGKVIKTDKKLDLALIKIKHRLPTLSLAHECPPASETVYEIGHPGKKEWVQTVGKSELIKGMFNLESHHGNSGSPIINKNGKVVGMNRSKIPFLNQVFGGNLDKLRDFIGLE